MDFYIASWEADNGIYKLSYNFDTLDYSLTHAASVNSATYFDKNGNILYALSENQGPGD